MTGMIPDVADADPDVPETWPDGLRDAVVGRIEFDVDGSTDALVAAYIRLEQLSTATPIDIEFSEGDQDGLQELFSA
jgi:hypothetical protein